MTKERTAEELASLNRANEKEFMKLKEGLHTYQAQAEPTTFKQ